MNFLYYKLSIAPALVALATLAGRRWGNVAAGLVAGLPIVAGPILFFYAMEQGPLYAVEASLATLLGVVSLCAFILAYAWRAWSGGSALSSLALGWVAFALATVLTQRVFEHHELGLLKALVYALAALFLTLRSLPPLERTVPGAPPAAQGRPAAPQESSPDGPQASPATKPGPEDLPLRMLSAALLVWVLTASAARLGPRLGGLLAPFPIATTVLAVFALRQGGSDAVRSLFRGLLLSLNAFAVFCAVLAAALVAWGLLPSFGAALAACFLVQAGTVLAQRKRPQSL